MTRPTPRLFAHRVAMLAFVSAFAIACSSPSPPNDGGIDGTVDAPACMSNQTRCVTGCADLMTDLHNCGSCGTSCPTGMVCAMGSCQLGCPPPEVPCGGVCVNTASDNANCGACGMACPMGQVCSSAHCGLSCGAHTMMCGGGDGGTGQPYCADTQSDRLNCGVCGRVCPMGDYCQGGGCRLSCPSGQSACSSRCVDFMTDPLNCGACGVVCATGQNCVSGNCAQTCATGQINCNGVCVNSMTDSANCGSCGTACGTGQICSGGMCTVTCVASQMRCGTSCVDLQTDPSNCGACGTSCMPGQVCVSGACTAQCPVGEMQCGSLCVDVNTDVSNCGACAHACTSGQVCNGGSCTTECGTGQMQCGSTCVTTSVDPANCGGCGNACAAGQACSGGSCIDLAMVDGGCPPPSAICGTSCVNLASNDVNCGACGTVCSPDKTCVNGSCIAPCGAGEARCGGTCTNILSDSRNCGTCGTTCTLPQVCVAGVCAVGSYQSYATSSVTTSFIDACALSGEMTVLTMGAFGGVGADDETATFTMPFGFVFYDYLGSDGWVSSNGAIGLGSLPSTSFSSTCLPDTGGMPNTAMVLWDDLHTRGTGVCIGTSGTAPNRQFVVEWNDTYFYADATSHITMEAIFYEGQNTFDFVYRTLQSPGDPTLATGNSATVGTQNTDMTRSTQYSCDMPGLAEGAAVRFTPM